jgi:hypothetical protein
MTVLRRHALMAALQYLPGDVQVFLATSASYE